MQQHDRDGAGGQAQPVGQQGRVRAVQAEVAVAETGVQLERTPEVHRGPQQVPHEHRVVEPAAAGQPAPGGLGDLRRRGRLRVQAEAGAVGGHRLDAHHARTPHRLPRRRPERRPVRVRFDAVGRHRLRDALQPHHLVRGRARGPGQLGRCRHPVRGEPGVDAEDAGARRAQEPPVDLLGAQLGPPGQVHVGGSVARQVQQGSAVAADGEADGAVERGDAGPCLALGQEGLETRPVQPWVTAPWQWWSTRSRAASASCTGPAATSVPPAVGRRHTVVVQSGGGLDLAASHGGHGVGQDRPQRGSEHAVRTERLTDSASDTGRRRTRGPPPVPCRAGPGRRWSPPAATRRTRFRPARRRSPRRGRDRGWRPGRPA